MATSSVCGGLVSGWMAVSPPSVGCRRRRCIDDVIPAPDPLPSGQTAPHREDIEAGPHRDVVRAGVFGAGGKVRLHVDDRPLLVEPEDVQGYLAVLHPERVEVDLVHEEDHPLAVRYRLAEH